MSLLFMQTKKLKRKIKDRRNKHRSQTFPNMSKSDKNNETNKVKFDEFLTSNELKLHMHKLLHFVQNLDRRSKRLRVESSIYNKGRISWNNRHRSCQRRETVGRRVQKELWQAITESHQVMGKEIESEDIGTARGQTKDCRENYWQVDEPYAERIGLTWFHPYQIDIAHHLFNLFHKKLSLKIKLQKKTHE